MLFTLEAGALAACAKDTDGVNKIMSVEMVPPATNATAGSLRRAPMNRKGRETLAQCMTDGRHIFSSCSNVRQSLLSTGERDRCAWLAMASVVGLDGLAVLS